MTATERYNNLYDLYCEAEQFESVGVFRESAHPILKAIADALEHARGEMNAEYARKHSAHIEVRFTHEAL